MPIQPVFNNLPLITYCPPPNLLPHHLLPSPHSLDPPYSNMFLLIAQAALAYRMCMHLLLKGQIRKSLPRRFFDPSYSQLALTGLGVK